MYCTYIAFEREEKRHADSLCWYPPHFAASSQPRSSTSNVPSCQSAASFTLELMVPVTHGASLVHKRLALVEGAHSQSGGLEFERQAAGLEKTVQESLLFVHLISRAKVQLEVAPRCVDVSESIHCWQRFTHGLLQRWRQTARGCACCLLPCPLANPHTHSELTRRSSRKEE